jgi:hypothetical protein
MGQKIVPKTFLEIEVSPIASHWKRVFTLRKTPSFEKEIT